MYLKLVLNEKEIKTAREVVKDLKGDSDIIPTYIENEVKKITTKIKDDGSVEYAMSLKPEYYIDIILPWGRFLRNFKPIISSMKPLMKNFNELSSELKKDLAYVKKRHIKAEAAKQHPIFIKQLPSDIYFTNNNFDNKESVDEVKDGLYYHNDKVVAIRIFDKKSYVFMEDVDYNLHSTKIRTELETFIHSFSITDIMEYESIINKAIDCFSANDIRGSLNLIESDEDTIEFLEIDSKNQFPFTIKTSLVKIGALEDKMKVIHDIIPAGTFYTTNGKRCVK